MVRAIAYALFLAVPMTLLVAEWHTSFAPHNILIQAEIRNMDLYWNTGGGYTEQQMAKMTRRKGLLVTRIPVESALTLRIDPNASHPDQRVAIQRITFIYPDHRRKTLGAEAILQRMRRQQHLDAPTLNPSGDALTFRCTGPDPFLSISVPQKPLPTFTHHLLVCLFSMPALLVIFVAELALLLAALVTLVAAAEHRLWIRDRVLQQHLSLRIAVVVGIVVVLFALCFGEYLAGQQYFVGGGVPVDQINQLYPMEVFRARQIEAGEDLHWTFQVGLGTQWAITQAKLLLTEADAYLHYLASNGDDERLAWLLIWRVLFYAVLTAGVFFAFLRLFGFSFGIALAGTAAFVFSGAYLVQSHWYFHYQREFLFTAMMLLGMELWLRRGDWMFLFFAVALFPIRSHLVPLHLFQLAFLLPVYMLARLLVLHPEDRVAPLLKNWGWRIVSLAGILILSTICIAYQIGPDLAGVTSSIRGASALEKMTFSETSGWASLFETASEEQRKTLVGCMIHANLLGDMSTFEGFRGWVNNLEASSLHIGLLPLLVIPAFLVLGRGRRRAAGLVLLAPALLFFAFPFYTEFMCGFASDTYDNTITNIVAFQVVLLCLALKWLFAEADRRAVAVFAGACILVWALLRDWSAGGLHPDYDPTLASLSLALLGVFAVLLTLMVWTAPGEDRRRIACIVVAASGLQLAWHGAAITDFDRGELTPKMIPGKAYWDDMARLIDTTTRNDPDFYRITKENPSVFMDDSLVQAYRPTVTYWGFPHPSVSEIVATHSLPADMAGKVIWPYNDRRRLANLLSVRYHLLEQGLAPDGMVEVAEQGGVQCLQNPQALPFGSAFTHGITPDEWAGLSRPERDELSVGALLCRSPEGLGLQRLAPGEIARYAAPSDLPTGAARALLPGEAVSWSVIENERLEGTLTTDGPRVVFFSFPYHPHWTAQLDGKPAPLVKVHGGFTGLVIPAAGDHAIILEYVPSDTVAWWVLSVCGYLLAAVFLWRWWKKKRCSTTSGEIEPSIFAGRWRGMGARQIDGP